MTQIIIIAAAAENNVIGKDNDIPWHIKEDFQHFKNKTKGFPCIMGRKTFESLPVKPLPNRENIVLTRSNFTHEGVTTFNNFNQAIEYCKKFEKIFIIGGSAIYKLGLEVADTIELTRIHKPYEGDTYFPEIDFLKWSLINQEEHEDIDLKSKEIIKFTFLTYIRKQNS